MPFRARTHGSARHPDVVIAAMIAERLGVEHVVTEPKPPGTGPGPDEADVIRRLRSAVLVSDGMLSAFENVGWPDPQLTAEPVQVGGHGGELLRGGYATAAWRNGRLARARSAARAPELFRRLTTRRLGLLRPAAAREYLASLAPYAAGLPRGPLRTLDDFYLINRAGRWSATARQGYLMRSPLVQPFFGDRVVRAARAVPLQDRITDRLHRGVLAALGPDLLDLPLAGSGWKSGPRTPSLPAAALHPPRAGSAATGIRHRAGVRGRARLAAELRGRDGRVPARLRPGPRRRGPDVRHRPQAGGRGRAAPSARRPGGGLGAGHPGRAAVGRLAECPRARRSGPGPGGPE